MITPDGRNRCCIEDFGGSHYHCAKCNRVTGMMGCGEQDELCDALFTADEEASHSLFAVSKALAVLAKEVRAAAVREATDTWQAILAEDRKRHEKPART